jgi:hypothetical protein
MPAAVIWGVDEIEQRRAHDNAAGNFRATNWPQLEWRERPPSCDCGYDCRIAVSFSVHGIQSDRRPEQ